MIDLACLGSFLAVVETGSFSAAAARLGLSQSGVSQHVARLEATFGRKLLVRNRRACAPSAAGVRVLPYARQLLALARAARAAVGNERLVVGASGNIGVYLLPDLMRRFRESTGGAKVEVEVLVDSNAEVLRRLDERLLDVALTEWVGPHASARGSVWRREPLVAIAPPDSPFAKRRSVSLAALAEAPMIGGEAGTGTATLLREVFGEAAAALKVRLAFGSTEGVKRAVMCGLGVSIVMRSAVESEVAQGRLAALRIEGAALAKPLYVVRQADAQDDAAPSRFSDFVKGYG